MVAQILLGSPLAQYITPTPLGFSVFGTFFKISTLVLISLLTIRGKMSDIAPN